MAAKALGQRGLLEVVWFPSSSARQLVSVKDVLSLCVNVVSIVFTLDKEQIDENPAWAVKSGDDPG